MTLLRRLYNYNTFLLITLFFFSPVDSHANQSVADEPDHEDHGVQHNENPFGLLGHYVHVEQIIFVLFVRHVGSLVKVVGAVFRHVRLRGQL